MSRRILKRFFVVLACWSFLFATFASAAHAAMVGTQGALNEQQRAEQVADVKEWLDREGVRKQLVAMGVDPDTAAERVATLTPAELQELHGKIEELPAGAGLVEAVGIVFVVLVILELLGVTHTFTGF